MLTFNGKFHVCDGEYELGCGATNLCNRCQCSLCKVCSHKPMTYMCKRPTFFQGGLCGFLQALCYQYPGLLPICHICEKRLAIVFLKHHSHLVYSTNYLTRLSALQMQSTQAKIKSTSFCLISMMNIWITKKRLKCT